MRDVVIDQKGSHLSCERDLLFVRHDRLDRPISLPLNQMNSLTITCAVDLTSTVLAKLADHGISVCIMSNGRASDACFVQGRWHAAVQRRIRQHQLLADPIQTAHWATVIVKLKLHRQIQLLHRLQYAAGHQTSTPLYEQTVQQLRTARRRLKTYFLQRHHCRLQPVYSLEGLRGAEGAAAAQYFRLYQSYFSTDLGFDHRNRRPPLDPVNTLLSLSYTLLQGICEQEVYSAGFDPYLGVLHDICYGRASLACDLAELQRCEIDYFVWELLQQGTITQADFSLNPHAERPCELLKVGRNRFYQAFSRLRPRLKKQARQQIWVWRRRIMQADTAQSEEMLHLSDVMPEPDWTDE